MEKVVFHRGMDDWDDSLLIRAYEKATGKTPSPRRPPPRLVAAGGDASAWRIGQLCRTVWTDDGVAYDAKIIKLDQDTSECTVEFVGYGNTQVTPLADLRPVSTANPSTSNLLTQALERGDDESDADSDDDVHDSVQETATSEAPAPPAPAPAPASASAAATTGGGKKRFRSTADEFPSSKRSRNIPVPPPPPVGPTHLPPPHIFSSTKGGSGNDDDNDDDEEENALGRLLTAWYYSGYYAGYYQALHQKAIATRKDTV